MKSCFVAVILLALPALAQKQRFTINANTPEGQMLQIIGEETDDAKKLVLMEGFMAKYPKHEGASWVCGQMEAVYLGRKDYDKALDAAEKGFSADPEDLDVAYSGLKAAEGKEDTEAVKIWASRTTQIARKTTGSGKAPADDEEKAMMEHARDVATYSEYTLYSQAVRAKDPKVTADLGEALEKSNPKSTYMWQAAPYYLRALGAVKGCAAADRLAAADSKNAEALLFSADCNWRANHPDRMVALGTRALEALGTRQKVEGLSDAGKSTAANFYIGVGYGMQQRYGPCEKALRIALPAVKGDATMGPYATYFLGVSVYYLGKPLGDKSRMREGMQFLEQSAAVKSAVQDLATQSAKAIRQELGGR
jgi:tetratricopeptide (TPR) repeat protein